MIYSQSVHGVRSNKEQEYLQGWQRERAELANFRKRVHEDGTAAHRRTLRELAMPLLGVADNFQAILSHVPDQLANDAWAQGVLHVARQLEGVLHEYGLRPIAAVGKPFDPVQHEAIEHVKDTPAESGMVIEVVQPGYVLGSDIVRPAKVKVAA